MNSAPEAGVSFAKLEQNVVNFEAIIKIVTPDLLLKNKRVKE